MKIIGISNIVEPRSLRETEALKKRSRSVNRGSTALAAVSAGEEPAREKWKGSQSEGKWEPEEEAVSE